MKKLAVGACLLFGIACSSGDSGSGNPGGIEGAFSNDARWVSSCEDADRFGIMMVSRYEIEGEAFRKVTDYHGDGTCSELALTTVEEGTMVRTLDGGSGGAIDFNYQRVEITPRSEHGVIWLNAVNYCGSNSWVVSGSRDITAASGGNCWVRTPRKLHDIFSVSGNDLFFGVGSDSQKAQARPSAVDPSRAWHIE